VALDPGARCAERAVGDAQDAEPDAKLVDEVEIRVGRAAHGGVVAPPPSVVLALDFVEGQRALVAWNTVGAVEIVEQVADAQRA
jgi:hypothetical protein